MIMQRDFALLDAQIKLQIKNWHGFEELSVLIPRYVINNSVEFLCDKAERYFETNGGDYSVDEPSLTLAVKNSIPKSDNLANRILEYNLQATAAHLRDTVFAELGRLECNEQTLCETQEKVSQKVSELKNSVNRWANTLSTLSDVQKKLKSLRELGVTEYRIVAESDERTTASCNTLDGKSIPLDEARVGENLPPFHFNCRCRIESAMISNGDLNESGTGNLAADFWKGVVEGLIDRFKGIKNLASDPAEAAKQLIVSIINNPLRAARNHAMNTFLDPFNFYRILFKFIQDDFRGAGRLYSGNVLEAAGVLAGAGVSRGVERAASLRAGRAGGFNGVGNRATTNTRRIIDTTPSTNHSTVVNNPGLRGRPNSSVDILDSQGNLSTRRWYDSTGRAVRDVDMTHHRRPDLHPEWPHEHFWQYDSNGNSIRK